MKYEIKINENIGHKYVESLGLKRHPEGGYFSQTYASSINITSTHVSHDFVGERPLSTSIYFLLMDDDVSHYHKLNSDEIWYYHSGEALTISVIDLEGVLCEYTLGLDVEKGQFPQIIVPAGSIFGAFIKNKSGYSLVGCMVSYGFHFEDFKLYNSKELLDKYPQYKEHIELLT